jgi:hypothetical protein
LVPIEPTIRLGTGVDSPKPATVAAFIGFQIAKSAPEFTIFYAWQSDTPGNRNRYLIDQALKTGRDQLGVEADIPYAISIFVCRRCLRAIRTKSANLVLLKAWMNPSDGRMGLSIRPGVADRRRTVSLGSLDMLCMAAVQARLPNLRCYRVEIKLSRGRV